MNIPKIAHFYWGMTPLPLLNALTVATFRHFNPEWTIKIWRPTCPGDTACPWPSTEQKTPYEGLDFLPALRSLSRIEEHSIPRAFDIPPGLHDVFTSDILRWRLLEEHGGVWSDFDIIYLAPITALDLPDCDIVYFHDGHVHIIGFYMARPGLGFFEAAFRMAHNVVSTQTGYQCIGSDLIGRIFPGSGGVKLMQLPMAVIYPFQWFSADLRKLFHGEGALPAPPTSIGVHWYNGGALSRAYINQLNFPITIPETSKLVIDRLVLQALETTKFAELLGDDINFLSDSNREEGMLNILDV